MDLNDALSKSDIAVLKKAEGTYYCTNRRLYFDNGEESIEIKPISAAANIVVHQGWIAMGYKKEERDERDNER